MQGNLKQVNLPEVLQFISMGKSTGLLTVRDPNGPATTLMIRQGKIINSTALQRQRRLGELLVHRGYLKRSVLSQLLSLQRTVDSDKRLGEILVEREIVSEETLRDVLRLQLEEEVWNLFGLEEGEFKFEQADESSLGEATVSIDIEPLLLEGSRRQDEWRKIMMELPSDRVVLGVSNNLKPDQEGNQPERPELSAAEWKVMSQVDGKTTIRALINRSGMGRFEVYRVVYDFLNKGLVYIKEDSDNGHSGRGGEADRESLSAPNNVRGMGGLLSRLTGGRARDGRADKFEFVTPIGAMGYFINRLTEQVLAMKEMKPQSEDRRLVADVWQDVLVNFTKADVVTVEGNRVAYEKMEAYVKLFEFSEATQDCYEDTVEALLQLLDSLYRIYSSRIGERQTQRLVKDLLDEMTPRTQFAYAKDFKLDERVQGVLKLAA